MLTFKLSPSLHLLFIPFHLESKVCFPYSADVESYRPHLDIISKLEEGWWQRRDEGAQRAGLLGLVVKRGLGGWVKGNWRSRCLLVSVLELVFVRRAGIQLEQIYLQGPWAHLISQPSSNEENTTLTSTSPCWQPDRRGNELFYLFEVECCDDLQLQELHNIFTLRRYHIIKEKTNKPRAFYFF